MNKNQPLILGGILLLIIIVALGYKSVNTTKNGEAQTEAVPTVVASAWNNLVESGSAHIVTNLDLSLPNTATQAANQPVVDIAIKTEGDGVWKDKPTYVGTFNITTKGRGMQLFTDGDIYILPDSTLFKLQNLPTLLNPSGNLLGKWTTVQGPLLRSTNPESVTPLFTSIMSNWNEAGSENSLTRYEKSFSEDEEKQIESVFKKNASGSEALNILARLVKNFTIDKAEAWTTPDGKELRQLKFHFVNKAKTDQQATLQFAFSNQEKEVTITPPQSESTVQPTIFSQLFGEPKPSPTPKPITPKRR